MHADDLIRQHIRSLREAAGMSQNDIASKLGIDPRNYARLERGERKQLDLQLLVAIATALELDLLVLLKPILTDRSPTDRGPADRSPADRGPADRSPTDRGPSHRKPEPIENIIEGHYENVITQLMDIIESQKRIIEEKTRVIQKYSSAVLNTGYERPNHNGSKDLPK